MAKYIDIRISRVTEQVYNALRKEAKKEKRTINKQALILIEEALQHRKDKRMIIEYLDSVPPLESTDPRYKIKAPLLKLKNA